MAHAGDVAMDGFQRLQKAVADHYVHDPTGAGIICAWIAARDVWYMSVCRYHMEFGEQKEVVAKAEDCDWAKCMMALAERWLEVTAIQAAPRVHLQDFVQKER